MATSRIVCVTDPRLHMAEAGPAIPTEIAKLIRIVPTPAINPLPNPFQKISVVIIDCEEVRPQMSRTIAPISPSNAVC